MSKRFVTIPDVEICRTGSWPAMSGHFDCTREDLDAAVRASQDDGFWAPRGKIGDKVHSAKGKAVGQFKNLRLVDNDDGSSSVLADHTTVPVEFASEMPSAYPSRSIEAKRDAVSPTTGEKYRLAFTAVELLGVDGPAVRSLPDITPEQIEAALQIAASATVEGDVVGEPIHESADESDDSATTPDASLVLSGDDPSDTGDTMSLTAETRTLLGLADDATDEQINTAITKLAADKTAADDQIKAAAAEKTTDDADDGFVRLSAGQLEELQAQARQGADASMRLREQEDDQILATAVKEGRITPAESGSKSEPGSMRVRLSADGTREETIKLLTAKPEDGGLHPGAVPTQILGSAGDGENSASADADKIYNAYLAQITGKPVEKGAN